MHLESTDVLHRGVQPLGWQPFCHHRGEEGNGISAGLIRSDGSELRPQSCPSHRAASGVVAGFSHLSFFLFILHYILSNKEKITEVSFNKPPQDQKFSNLQCKQHAQWRKINSYMKSSSCALVFTKYTGHCDIPALLLLPSIWARDQWMVTRGHHLGGFKVASHPSSCSFASAAAPPAMPTALRWDFEAV